MEVMKQLRQRAIRDLVEQRPIRTQQELATALRERGFRTTQATISRDVAELGLIKVAREGTAAYALPPRLIEAETSGEDRLRKLLSDLPLEIHEAGLLLVLRTLPGLGPRDRGRARPGALARGRGLDRRRRHPVRGASRPRLAPAHQAPAAAAVRGRPVAALTGPAGGPPTVRRALTAARHGTTIRARSELQVRGSCREPPGVLSFIDLDRPARSDHLTTCSAGATGREQQAHLPLQGGSRPSSARSSTR